MLKSARVTGERSPVGNSVAIPGDFWCPSPGRTTGRLWGVSHGRRHRRTPRSVFDARQKAEPTAPLIKINGRRLRLDKVDTSGSVTLRHKGRLHHIGIGRAYAGWSVAMLIEGLDIEVVGIDGSPLRRLVLDTTKDYQRTP